VLFVVVHSSHKPVFARFASHSHQMTSM
jgi:hypothetical protein